MGKFMPLHAGVLTIKGKYNAKSYNIFANTLKFRMLARRNYRENIILLLAYFTPIRMISASKRSFSTQDLFLTLVL